MIGCLAIPGFELRAALREQPALATRPAALAAGAPGAREPRVGAVTAAAEAAGVKSGMRLGEALAMCPALVLVEQDPARVNEEWEAILRRLEDDGFAVEPVEPGCLYFETRGVERLYGGVEPALRRALATVGAAWDARAGAAERRFAALAAASVARAGQIVVVSSERTREFLAPLPLRLLPLDPERRDELRELGIATIGQLAQLPEPSVAERLGGDGSRAWRHASGVTRGRVDARSPVEALAETLDFPEAVANELTLRRALAVLVDRVLTHRDRGDRTVRKLTLSARLPTGGSWRRTATLRDATADAGRLRAALGPKLAELPAPVLRLRLELTELGEPSARQLELVRPQGDELRERLKEGLRQTRSSAGAGAVCAVVEVAPWSRIPEQRALLVPRD